MATTKTTKATKAKRTTKARGGEEKACAADAPENAARARAKSNAENAADPKPTTAAKPSTKKARAGEKPKAGEALGPTMEELAELYLLHLEQIGKSRGTVFSYSIDLAVAVRELGKGTRLKTLTPERVGAFFDSDAVKKTRAGKPKAKPTIDKTRRVLRLALVWAAETGQVPVAPIPDDVVDGRKARAKKGDDGAADGKGAKGRGDDKGDGAAGGKDGAADAPIATAKRRRRARKPRVTEVCLHDQEAEAGEGGGEENAADAE